MKNYNHLTKQKENELDNVLTNNIPPISLRNNLTSNIILSMEKLLKTSFEKLSYQIKYFSH